LWDRLHCSKYFRPWVEEQCSFRRFVPSSWEDIVWDLICALLQDDAWLELQLASEQSQKDNIERLIKTEQSKISQAEAKIKRIREGFENGLYDLDEAKDCIHEQQTAIAKKEKEIQILRERIKECSPDAVDIPALKAELKTLRDRNLDEADFYDKLDVVTQLGIAEYEI